MKTRKKNRFLTFCLSMVPGAGEMYMGFMRTGVSLMIFFITSIMIPVFLNLGALATFALVVWFYGFFHANHLASLNDEEFAQVKDEYLFGMEALANGRDFVAKYQKWVAAGLIFAGVWLLWNTLVDLSYRFLPDYLYNFLYRIGNYVPSVVVALLIIFIGVRMINGRREELAQQETEAVKEAGAYKEAYKEADAHKEAGIDKETEADKGTGAVSETKEYAGEGNGE